MRRRNDVMTLAIAAALGAGSTSALASGFQLIEQNSSGLGNAYAGQAAAAEDASTVYFNPAGMAYLPGRQAVFAVHVIVPSVQFANIASTAPSSTPGFRLGPVGGDATDTITIPNLYLTWAVDPQWTLGLGVNAPFGLRTDYDANWLGRFHALKSDVKTINVNPSVSYKVNDVFAVGFGVNWQRVEAEMTKGVNYSAIANNALTTPGLTPAQLFALNTVAGAAVEGSNRIDGADSSWGYNFGVMINLTDAARVGLAYRSAVGHKLGGQVTYYNRPAVLSAFLPASAALSNQIGDSPVSADIKMPASFSAAVKHKLSPRWDLLADATWTQWTSFESLTIVRTAGLGAGTLEATPQNWRDTWRFGLGANYHHNDAWTMRLGVAYDQTPTDDTYRTPRIPDNSRTWLAIGAQYKVSSAGAIDVGYAHLFVQDASINLSGPPAITAAQAGGRGALVGASQNKVDLFSVQYRHSF
jgi:long-chain fatty acid transport protein